MSVKKRLTKLIENAPVWKNASFAEACAQVADYLVANDVGFATDINDGCKWKRSAEELPKNFMSVLGYIPSAAPMPTVRECYTIHDQFYFPALNAMYSAQAVTRWRYMPEEPKEGDRK